MEFQMVDYCSLKSSLQAKLEELLERATGIENDLRSPGEKDWEDNAIAKENEETLTAVGNATEKEIQEIKLALRRIDSGEYGLCKTCNKPIGKARLDAIPWASTCVGCA
jgi:DnaK suppressor protein